ncbi:hypothetical protein [Colwellia echini]|uniref:MSHA biogenesis protein MshI n=1 Tax=Colwellia echini TaxID=1982103 RepID=A0ABY3N199_9GAMM|nr:hypothetical protein [Colwellia echini]TYK67136.1 hypothetical protein CWS31_000960 [Colwellia echini]
MSFLTKISQIFSKSGPKKHIGIAFQQQGISLCSIPDLSFDNEGAEAKIGKVIFQHEKTYNANFIKTIQAFHNENDLDGKVTLVLSEAQSHIVQVDKPTVSDEEINSALKWQVKDLVSISADNMLLDYYDAPRLAGGKEKINVVCAPLDELKNIVMATEQGSLKVEAIITQEFAFANLLPAQSDAILLVCSQPDEEIVLIIVKDNQIFFHRRLRGYANIADKTETELSSRIIDDISLEIQRSTDYFERQLKQAPIKGIKVLLPITLESVFVEKLAENTAAPVSLLELPRPYHQHREFAAAIGASIENIPYDSEVDASEGAHFDH